MRRLCLFSGGFAMATALYLILLHAAPGVLLAALAAVCALLFLLRRPIAHRTAVCVLGLLTGFAWCRGYEALFLRPFASLSGETAAFSAQALAAPQTSSYGQSVSARLTLDGKSCTAVRRRNSARKPPVRHGEVHHGAGKASARQGLRSVARRFSDGKLPRAAARRAGTRFRLAGACYAGGTAPSGDPVRVPVRYGEFCAGAAAGR